MNWWSTTYSLTSVSILDCSSVVFKSDAAILSTHTQEARTKTTENMYNHLRYILTSFFHVTGVLAIPPKDVSRIPQGGLEPENLGLT
jgi:hypothetical protein